MFCSKCGAEVPEGSSFCPKCGTNIAPVAPVEAPQPAAPQPAAPQSAAPAAAPVPPRRPTAPHAVSGFVLSLIGYGLCWIPILGFALAIAGTAVCGKGRRAIAPDPAAYSAKGLLIAGKILGILGIIGGAIMLIVTVILIAIGESYFDLLGL